MATVCTAHHRKEAVGNVCRTQLHKRRKSSPNGNQNAINAYLLLAKKLRQEQERNQCPQQYTYISCCRGLKTLPDNHAHFRCFFVVLRLQSYYIIGKIHESSQKKHLENPESAPFGRQRESFSQKCPYPRGLVSELPQQAIGRCSRRTLALVYLSLLGFYQK